MAAWFVRVSLNMTSCHAKIKRKRELLWSNWQNTISPPCYFAPQILLGWPGDQMRVAYGSWRLMQPGAVHSFTGARMGISQRQAWQRCGAEMWRPASLWKCNPIHFEKLLHCVIIGRERHKINALLSDRIIMWKVWESKKVKLKWNELVVFSYHASFIKFIWIL